jgi:glycine/D-amino acid oxidase-like deaminating enzyme
MVSDEYPELGIRGPRPGEDTPSSVHLHVDDCDAVVAEAVAAGRVTELLESRVTAIGPDSVDLIRHDRPHRIDNDIVIVCAGGVLPTQFLREIGIAIETKFGVA